MISIIVPVLNEAAGIEEFLSQFANLTGPYELVIVDGGSRDRTVELARHHTRRLGLPARIMSSARGRAKQMNFGAKHSTGGLLLFLHADTFLPPDGLEAIRLALADPRVAGGRFKVRLHSDGFIYRLIARGINWRDRTTGGFTGDQAIFLRRELFRAVGGYPEIPLLEDVDLARRLKRVGCLVSIHSPVTTSARRWQKSGPVQTAVRMWAIKGLFLAGVSPNWLARFYPDVR